MMRTEDGSIRGTVKMIENIKLHQMQKDVESKRRGEGAWAFLILYSLTQSSLISNTSLFPSVASKELTGLKNKYLTMHDDNEEENACYEHYFVY
jgi:hypothetical protein